MKEIIIKVSENYHIPSNIINISTDEWELILSSISNLFLKHDSISAKITESDIQRTIDDKYSAQISSLEDKINTQLKEITSIKEDHDKQLKKQRKEIETQFKVSNTASIQSIKVSLQEISDSKDAIIKSFKNQVTELQQTLAELNNPLHIQINKQTLELKELKDSYENQLKKQRKEIEDQYNASNKLLLQETSESKDLIIQSLKIQINELPQHITKIHNDQISTMQLQINTYHDQLAAQSNKANKQATAAIQQLTAEHKSEITNIHAQYFDQMNKLHDQENKRIADKTASMTDQFNAQVNAQTNLQNILLKALEPVTKFYGGTALEKGNGGEVAVREILISSKSYDEAIIEDVSGHAANGDIIFTWKKMRCLIEVKNKSYITKDDIDKFMRDVTQTNNINCALFISLQSNNLPGKSRELLQLDYINGIPVLYTFMPPPLKEIHFAIACLERIIQTYDSTNNYQEELQQYFIRYYADVLEYQKFFDQEIQKRQKEIKALTKHFDHFDKLCDQLSPIYSRISKVLTQDDDLDNESTPCNENEIQEPAIEEKDNVLSTNINTQLTQLAQTYIKMSLKHTPPTIKLLSESFNVSDKIVECIGFKNIAAHAKSIYLQQVITTDKAKKITEFNTANGRYPNRKELISNKIFMDQALRSISRVTKQKKVAETIQEFCSTQSKPILPVLETQSSVLVQTEEVKSKPVALISNPIQTDEVKSKPSAPALTPIKRKTIRRAKQSLIIEEPPN